MIPRFGLSGTVVQNDFSELWCLLDLLNPRKYGDGVKSWEFLVSVSSSFGAASLLLHWLTLLSFSLFFFSFTLLPGSGYHQDRNGQQINFQR